ncbi:MAG: hypothetical protein WBL58_04335 [Peptococcia bacterium]
MKKLTSEEIKEVKKELEHKRRALEEREQQHLKMRFFTEPRTAYAFIKKINDKYGYYTFTVMLELDNNYYVCIKDTTTYDTSRDKIITDSLDEALEQMEVDDDLVIDKDTKSGNYELEESWLSVAFFNEDDELVDSYDITTLSQKITIVDK